MLLSMGQVGTVRLNNICKTCAINGRLQRLKREIIMLLLQAIKDHASSKGQRAAVAVQGHHLLHHRFTVNRVPWAATKYLRMMVRVIHCTQLICCCVKKCLELLTLRISSGSLWSFILDMCTLQSYLHFNRNPGSHRNGWSSDDDLLLLSQNVTEVHV